MKKFISLVVALCLMMTCLTGCHLEESASKQDKKATLEIADKLSKNQPTPTDIDYSLERYNLIKRAYWVNGQREKANTLPCEIEKPLGYIVLFTESGSTIGSFVVDGKVSSLNSFLTPDSEYYEKATDYKSGDDISLDDAYDSWTASDKYSNKWLADVDGS